MARLNVEEEWFIDETKRRLALIKVLCRAFPGLPVDYEIIADGMAMNAWRLAQQYWKKGKKLIPEDVWRRSGFEPMIDAELAERRPEGIYVRGSAASHEWIRKHVNGGLVRADSAERDEKGHFLPKKSSETPAAAQRSLDETPAIASETPATAGQHPARLQRHSSDRPAESEPSLGFAGLDSSEPPASLLSSLFSENTEINSKGGGVTVARARVDPDPPPPPEKIDAPPGLSPEAFVRIWNDHRGNDLPAAVGMHPRRRIAILDRIAEKPDPAYWVATVKRIAASDFVSGRKPGRDGEFFDGSLDWLVSDAKWHVSVNEGLYDTKQRKKRQGHASAPPAPNCARCWDTGFVKADREGEGGEFACACAAGEGNPRCCCARWGDAHAADGWTTVSWTAETYQLWLERRY